jgi:glycosyltransferase involved in cell wall biosynthesis
VAHGGEKGADDKSGTQSLRILHVMRAPVGGLFRHVADLAGAQAQAGHEVGVVADLRTGGEEASRVLNALAPHLALGVTRLPMRRMPNPADFAACWRVAALIQRIAPDIVHGHGAKGGLYARLPALLPMFPKPRCPPALVYTPHGGSLHFRPQSFSGKAFFTAERLMGRVTDLMPFESDYARRRFSETVEPPRALATVVHNGLASREFAPAAPRPDAADFVFVGEMRAAKGVAELLHAFAALPDHSRLALVGSGADEMAFRALSRRLGLETRVQFLDRMPTREALQCGRILVVPSRAESLPYIVLEAIAAKAPVIATDAGGISEIFGRQAHRLVPTMDARALADAMREMLKTPPEARAALADEMAAFVRQNFSIESMYEGVLRGYRAALASKRAATSGHE